jgi:hypothetical protein
MPRLSRSVDKGNWDVSGKMAALLEQKSTPTHHGLNHFTAQAYLKNCAPYRGRPTM